MLITQFNCASTLDTRLTLASGKSSKPSARIARRRANIWCKVVSSVPKGGDFTMRDVEGDAVWAPFDFAAFGVGTVVAGGRSKSSDRFIGLVTPGVSSEVHGEELTGIAVDYQVSDVGKFYDELIARMQ